MLSPTKLAEMAAGSANTINLPGQTGNISSVILALTTSGKHRVNAVMTCTSGSGGAANVNLRLSWTGDVAISNQQICSLPMAATGVATAVWPLYLVSGNATFDTTGYTAGTYALRVWVEYGGT